MFPRDAQVFTFLQEFSQVLQSEPRAPRDSKKGNNRIPKDPFGFQFYEGLLLRLLRGAFAKMACEWL